MKLIHIVLFTSILILFILGIMQPIQLVTSDLGRHITNGLVVFSKPEVFTQNFYSYTNSTYPFINHHWGTGVLFAAIYQTTGFTGLSIAGIILQSVVFILFFLLAASLSNPPNAIMLSLLFFPLLISRTEIRPELFTYLFLALFLIILKQKRRLLLLPLLMVFWVNLHIYFPLGYVTIMLFAVCEKEMQTKKHLFLVFGLTLLATCVSPNGIRGAIAPYTIFTNYAYPLLENRSVLAISPAVVFPLRYPIFLALAVSLLFLLISQKNRTTIPWIILSLIACFFGISAIRNSALLGYIGLITTSALIPRRIHWVWLFIPLIIMGVFIGQDRQYWINRTIGVGISPQSLKPIEVYKKLNLKGPIFNNYDIGGYLIYGLYPDEKVFIDNRPEAYPASFFTNTYIPMQLGAKWESELAIYQFQTIIFSKTDLTSWGRNFMFRRSIDPKWKIVYEDDAVIIFQRNASQ